MRAHAAWGALITLTVVSGYGPAGWVWAQEAEPAQGDPAAGRRILLEKNCLMCHSVLGRGGVSAPDLAKLGVSYTYFQLVGLMWGHSPKMMETAKAMGLTWPKFTPGEMEDITGYIHSLGETRDMGTPALGERIFEQVCINCHMVGGRGKTIGQNLDPLGLHPSGVRIAMAMWNHGSAMTDVMKSQGIPRPVFGESDIADLIAYIRARSRDLGPIRYSPIGDPAAGRTVFSKSGCATCHGPSGRGDVGPDLAATGPQGVARIAAQLWNHAPEMHEEMQRTGISVPTLDERETEDLMAFLGFLGYIDTQPDLEHGKMLYEQKGCVECHGEPGNNNGLAPDLSGIQTLKTRSGVAAAMWNHAPAMAEALETERSQLSWPRFVGDEMRDLIGYLGQIAYQVEESTR